MKTWIALFRGVNVGGHQMLPMKNLSALLAEAGFHDVRTYIQSGNVVFRSDAGTATSLAARIGGLISKHCGFEPKVFVMSVAELRQAAAQNPFSQAQTEPRTLHLFFLSRSARSPDLASLQRLKTAREAFSLQGKVFYLYAPEGVGNSKLAANAERCIAVDTTARNWRTVTKLLEMADEVSAASR